MEIQRFRNEFIKPNLPKNRREWVWFILLILVVVTLGLVAVNTYLDISYKATLIQSPCNLCDDFLEKQRLYSINGFDLNNLGDINITAKG